MASMPVSQKSPLLRKSTPAAVKKLGLTHRTGGYIDYNARPTKRTSITCVSGIDKEEPVSKKKPKHVATLLDAPTKPTKLIAKKHPVFLPVNKNCHHLNVLL